MQDLNRRTVPTQLVAVGAFERRTTHHTAVAVVRQPLPNPLQPRVAIVVVQRFTRGHLGDVGGRVQGVGVHEGHPQPFRERRAHRRLAGAGDTHHHYELRFHSTQPTPLRPSAVLTLAQARGNWLTRPSAAVRRNGACPRTSTFAAISPGLTSNVVSIGNPLAPKVSRASTVCSSATLRSGPCR